jgi:hypothetical protein
MMGEIVLGWPPRLDDDHLEVVPQVTITGTRDGEAEARIFSYQFRTARQIGARGAGS